MKIIFVTGGVLSGLGKGVAAASIGHLLSDTYRVGAIKLDGYLNVDPGTMNPIEHGEVFVLEDGSEVDMDFGHYERFLKTTPTGEHSITMGKVFSTIMSREREGDYLGKTVQFVPHVTDHIKERILSCAQKLDVLLVEVGGTIGDIENELYVEAARQLADDVGANNCLFVHLAYVPRPGWIGEHKTKPAQQSTQLLLQRGIIPDVIIARCEEPVPEDIKHKIRRFCNCAKVISGHDLPDVYQIPRNFANQGLLEVINDTLGLQATYSGSWDTYLEALACPEETLTIGIAGKYTALEDSYASVVEAIKHSCAHVGVAANIVWVETSEDNNVEEVLSDVDAVIVPGGFGSRGIEGKIRIIQYCRENNVPYLGLCYGLQLAVVEFARNVCKLAGAHTTEVHPDTKHPVVDILKEQKAVTQKGGTMRLGAYTAQLQKNSLVAGLYDSLTVSERHRHRYEVNPFYHETFLEHGLVFSGMYEDLVEFIELPEHPFFVATQAHPELKSSLDAPAPVFLGLVRSAKKQLVQH
ncbi:MAG: CTP synthase [Candidatus Woesearchaeota archaeon]